MPPASISTNDGITKATLEYTVQKEEVRIHYNLQLITEDERQRMRQYPTFLNFERAVSDQVLILYLTKGIIPTSIDAVVNNKIDLLGTSFLVSNTRSNDPSEPIFSDYKIIVTKKEKWCDHFEYLAILVYDGLKANMPDNKQ